MEMAIVIPARLASTRFPRKLLHPVRGKPLILWTAERVAGEAPEMPLFFAVADSELAEVLNSAGFQTVMTDPDLPSGTDRIGAANERIGADLVINVQADEPLVRRSHIERLAGLLSESDAAMSTLATPCQTAEEYRNPNRVKVVCDRGGYALYFSRSPIPFSRDRGVEVDDAWVRTNPCLVHLGLYGYRREFLAAYPELPRGPLEDLEKLEQLRALENGHRIAVGRCDEPTMGIDVPEDAERLVSRLA